MKVANNVCSRPVFTSTMTHVYDASGNIINCHYTKINRRDINWGKFPVLLSNRYCKQERVPVNLFGSSDGSDVYTLIINLMKTLGNKAKKFFPILASDISPETVKAANESRILLTAQDLDYIQKMDADRFFERDYNEKVQVMREVKFFPFKVKNELRDKVDFSVQDVRKAVKENNFSDSVFMFRNGWGFNTLEEQNEIAKSLYENSNCKTLVGIGQSNLYKSGASDALQRNNFKGIETDVFTFFETDYPAQYVGTPKTKPVFKEFGFFEKK